MSTVTRSTSESSGKRSTAEPGGGLLGAGRRSATAGPRPRNRSWGLVTLAALLVVGAGLAVAAWGMQVGEKTSALAMGSPVAKGQVIERSDLVSTAVAGVEAAVPVAQIDTVVGQTAAVDLVAGQILTPAMTASGLIPGPGRSTVGLALDPTRVPSAGLGPGDRVDVVAVPGGDGQVDPEAVDAPEVLAAGAEVLDATGDAVGGGQMLLTLVVDEGDAARIAAYSTQNRVAVVEIAAAAGGF